MYHGNFFDGSMPVCPTKEAKLREFLTTNSDALGHAAVLLAERRGARLINAVQEGLGQPGRLTRRMRHLLLDLRDLSGYVDANDNIVLLEGLHLEAFSSPTDIRQLLAEAQASLESLMQCVQKISAEDVVDARAPSDLDAWVCWSGARLQDIVVTLSRALEA